MDSSPASIPVVCAVIERDGRVLLAQRPANKHLSGKWEFPGGKVESGETPADALIREIREELACEIRVTRALPSSVHDYPNVRIELIPFVCELSPDSPPPVSHEHAAIAWVQPCELLAHDLAPADIPIVEHYLNP